MPKFSHTAKHIRSALFICIALNASCAFAETGKLDTSALPDKTAEKKESAVEAKVEAKTESKAESKTESKADAKIETIEVKSTNTYDARREDTATKIVVTEAEINKFGDTQLADVLKRLPGITVIGSSIRMRGLGAGYTQILIDGERAPAGFTIDQLSPAMIERIEIVRAATAEFSTQSIAGTINIVLKKKVSLAQRQVRASYTRGSFYTSPSADFLVSDKVGSFSYTVSGYVYQNTNDYPYSNIETGFDATGKQILLRQFTGLSEGTGKGGGLGPRLNWTLANGDTLGWQMFINTNTGGGTNESRYTVTQGIPAPFQTLFSTYDYTANNFRNDLNWGQKFKEGAKLDMKFGFNINRNENNNTLRGFNQANQQSQDRTQYSESKDNGVTFTGKYSTPIVEGHSLVAGWDTSVNQRDEVSRQRDLGFANISPPTLAFASDDNFEARVLKLAAFAQDEWNVTKNWSVYLGLRWESLTTTTAGKTFSEVSNRSSVWSPLMQTLYKLPGRQGEQVRLALTRTYKAPNTFQLIPRLFRSIENKPTSPDSRGNPDLQPELATGIDIALEKFWGQGASVSLSGNIRRITGYNRRGLLFINDRWTSLPINDGNAETKSLEFDAKFPIQSLYKEAPPIDFRLNLNRNWSSVDKVPGPNNRLDSQTPFSGTLGLDYRMKNGEVVAGGSYSYRGGGRVRTSVTQEAFLTAKRDLDMYLLWKITPKTQFRLTLSNILKAESVNESVYFDQFGSTRNTNTTPSKMNIRAGVEVKF
jgi:outer membrane receptor for ferrienterochelin and colicins